MKGLRYVSRCLKGATGLLDDADFMGSMQIDVADEDCSTLATVHFLRGTPLFRVMEALEWLSDAGKVMGAHSAVSTAEEFAVLEDAIGRACPVGRVGREG